MAKKILAVALIISAILFFGYHTFHYGAVITARDEAALQRFHMEYNAVHP